MARSKFPIDAKREGVEISWHRKDGEIVISGWYDSIVGMWPESLPLGAFFGRLGITKEDCDKAFAELKKEKP